MKRGNLLASKFYQMKKLWNSLIATSNSNTWSCGFTYICLPLHFKMEKAAKITLLNRCPQRGSEIFQSDLWNMQCGYSTDGFIFEE